MVEEMSKKTLIIPSIANGLERIFAVKDDSCSSRNFIFVSS
jgi:hypothetical protein